MTASYPLRVLQLVPALHEGGTEQGAYDMARYITAQGGKAWVASSGGGWADALTREGIPHITLPLQRKAPWYIVWNMIAIWRLIHTHRIDIVHARSRGPAWSGWLACQLSFFTRVKFITTYHGTYGAHSAIKRWYNKVMLRGPVVIANSRFIAQHLKQVYEVPNARIVVAPRGVDETRFDPDLPTPALRRAVRHELDVPDNEPLLLMVGRITRWKGHDILIKALSQLTDLPWVVALAGDAKNLAYLNELRALAHQLGVESRIRWLGPRRDIPMLNAAADIALSCSVQPEAFGRVAIEAMAMGTPILATAHGGSLETVLDGQTGWLVPPGDVEALARQLRLALEEPNVRARMGAMGKRHVQTHFTRTHTCKAEWSAYMILVGNDATGGTRKGPAKA